MADAAAVKPIVAKKPKAPAAYPAFSLMIKEAIVTLKERTGSSSQAIAKYIGGKYGTKLPSNWSKVLSVTLKRLVESGKLVKVKASYKLGEAMKTVVKKKAVKVAKKKPAAKKPAAAKAKKPAAAKAKKPAAAKAKKPAATKAKKPAAAKVKKPVAAKPKATKPAAPKKAKVAAKGGVKKVKTAKKTAPKKAAAKA